ncbi:MAG: class II fumarate hydratase [Planctomycetota bacterium]|nr:class II fumarate hydratase [Planctomycetota bacterium]
MIKHRRECDSLGEVSVPADALYGAQTARAVENFPISGRTMPVRFIAALGLIKTAAAVAHKKAGRLDGKLADAIIAAAKEVAAGQLNEHFPVDVFQTGSGTSSNMNANEVITNRANQLLGRAIGSQGPVHPNDHVNMGQSSNDVIPSAVHISSALAIHNELIPALKSLSSALATKAGQFDAVVKVGRTHLQDAVPIRLGQEFSGYAAAVDGSIGVLGRAIDGLCELAIGGTAVGTEMNCPEGFAGELVRFIAGKTHLPFHESANHFAAHTVPIPAVRASGALKITAIAVSKIANDIRLLGSGPRCGFGELILPAVQPGSSIMPGKVNPVIPEAVVQVACRVVGLDAAVSAAALGGVGSILEMHLAWPVIADNLLEGASLLTNAVNVFRKKCIEGLTADAQRCGELIERSLMLATALAPKIGYDAAVEIAKQAHETGKTIREIAIQQGAISEEELNELLDVRSQTGP